MYTVVRKDAIEGRESPPLKTLSGKDIFTYDLAKEDRLFQSIQPESWEDRVFDILLVSELTGEIYYGISVYWEYISYDEAKPEVKAEVKRFKAMIKEQMTYAVPLKATDLCDAEKETPNYRFCDPISTDLVCHEVMEISEEEFIKLGGKV